VYKYVIDGPCWLRGEVGISGSKNAAVAILPAVLLVDGVCRIENIPRISDVSIILEIMTSLGARVRTINASTIEIDARAVKKDGVVPDALMRKMRASYYIYGSMLGRFGKVTAGMPGGCDFGVRPIDQHIKGFEALGAHVEIRGGMLSASAPDGLTGSQVYCDVSSVGTTINIMLASALTDGLTIIENAHKAPYVVDLANFLNSVGADIKGAGTNVIKIRGVPSLSGGTYTIIPDTDEAGTYMAAVTATGGDILLTNVIPKHLEGISAKLMEMGVAISEFDDSVRVSRTGLLTRTNIKTMPYPAFPTDLQSPIAVALCLAEGTSIVTETIWQRFRYVDELKRMGAHIQVDGQIAIIEGVESLSAASVRACDMRAGAAMVIAALCASGVSEVESIEHIERGYEDFVEKVRSLGGKIRRVPCSVPQIANIG